MDKTISVIRHGETLGNARRAYIGITDESLSKKGIEVIRMNNYPPADIVFSSPLKRCIQTAKLIYPEHTPIIIDDLRETDFGIFEGKNYIELKDIPEYQSWIDSRGNAPFPGGESREQALERALKGFEQLLGQTEDAKNISMVAHGGTIMAILSHYFGGDYYSYIVKNGEGYTFDLSHDGVFSGLRPGLFSR